jgi:hypothetical protein
MSIESVLKVFVVRVDVIQDSISIGLMAGRENYHLEFLVRFLQTLHKVGSQVDTRTDDFLPRKIDFKYNIRVLTFDVINTVNQSFIHVKNKQLFLFVMHRRRQVNVLVLYLALRYHRQVVSNERKRLKSMFKVLLVQVCLTAVLLWHLCHKLLQRLLFWLNLAYSV